MNDDELDRKETTTNRTLACIAAIELLLGVGLVAVPMLSGGGFSRLESAAINQLIITTGVEASDVVGIPRPAWIDTSLAAGELSISEDNGATVSSFEGPYSTGEALTVAAPQW